MENHVKNYIITDQLNANAVNSRYGRPASELGEDRKVFIFEAASDEEAFQVFDDAIESGYAGYSELNPQRVVPKLWRTKAFFGGGKPLFATIA
jgi:hypothetical protein